TPHVIEYDDNRKLCGSCDCGMLPQVLDETARSAPAVVSARRASLLGNGLSPYRGLIDNYGLLDLSKIVAERFLDRLTAGAVSRFFFERAMDTGHVYFGEHLGARQGVLRRHFFMYRLASLEVSREPTTPFRVLEVGTYAGGSAITWALAIKSKSHPSSGSVVCVDPWRNYLTKEDIEASATPDVLREMSAALEDEKVFRLFEHNVRVAHVA